MQLKFLQLSTELRIKEVYYYSYHLANLGASLGIKNLRRIFIQNNINV